MSRQSESHRQQSKGSNTNGCCGCFRTNKVSPIITSNGVGDIELMEIRPGRFLRVRHINPQQKHAKNDYGPKAPFGTRSQANMDNLNNTLAQSDLPGQASINGDFHNPKEYASTNSTKQSKPKVKVKCRVATASSVCVDVSDQTNGAINLDGYSFLQNGNMNNAVKATSQFSQNTKPRASSASSAYSMTEDDHVVMFFIHGVGGSSDVWKGQLDYFAGEGYELLAPDLIGHGFSLAPRDSSAYTFKEISEDLLTLFDKYCNRRNVVIGHSYGSCFAAVLARRRPRKVHKLIMVSGGSPTPLAPQPGVFSLPSCMLGCCRPMLNRGFQKSAFYEGNKTCVPPERAFDVPTYVLKHTMNGQIWLEGDAEFHREISVPALLIHGKDDLLVSVEEEMEMIEALFGSTLQVLEGASHMVMMEKPEEVNKLMQAFLLSNFRLVGSAQHRSATKRGLPAEEEMQQVAGSRQVCKSPEPPRGRRMAEIHGEEVHASTTSLRSARSIPSRLISHNLRN